MPASAKTPIGKVAATLVVLVVGGGTWRACASRSDGPVRVAVTAPADMRVYVDGLEVREGRDGGPACGDPPGERCEIVVDVSRGKPHVLRAVDAQGRKGETTVRFRPLDRPTARYLVLPGDPPVVRPAPGIP